MKAFFREILVTLIMAVVIFFLLQVTIQSAIIRYSCMEPGLHEGQRVLVNKVVYYFHEPERGDVIIFHPPRKPKDAVPYIKRIIGLPGDTMEIKGGVVYINGSKLHEEYVEYPADYPLDPYKIPEGEYFVLGANRPGAEDSHNWGTLNREDIIGKAWLTYWPPDAWGIVVTPLQE